MERLCQFELLRCFGQCRMIDVGKFLRARPDKQPESSSWPGFVPAIHVFSSVTFGQDVDARDKRNARIDEE